MNKVYRHYADKDGHEVTVDSPDAVTMEQTTMNDKGEVIEREYFKVMPLTKKK